MFSDILWYFTFMSQCHVSVNELEPRRYISISRPKCVGATVVWALCDITESTLTWKRSESSAGNHLNMSFGFLRTVRLVLWEMHGPNRKRPTHAIYAKTKALTCILINCPGIISNWSSKLFQTPLEEVNTMDNIK